MNRIDRSDAALFCIEINGFNFLGSVLFQVGVLFVFTNKSFCKKAVLFCIFDIIFREQKAFD